MASISTVIVPAKVLKGGKHKVRIAIAHNSETRYIITDVKIDSEKEFKNGQVVKRDDAAFLNTKLRKSVNEIQRLIDEISNMECLTCSELIDLIQNTKKRKKRTISSVFKEYIEVTDLKPRTIALYNVIYRSIEAYTGPNMLVEHITPRTVIGFDKWLRDRKLKGDSIRTNMILLVALVKYSQRCQYAEFTISPFTGYKMPERTVRQSWITVEQVKTIRDLQTKKKSIEKCRDIFMLSYYLGGINMIDLLKINFDECTPLLSYIRTKTEKQAKLNKYVEFEIPEEAIPIILKCKDKDRKLQRGGTFQELTAMHQFLGYNIHRLAEATGIKNLVFYSARKSFSQHAFMLGVNTSVIDYILGHKIDNVAKSLYSYIKVTPEMATQAIRKVLDNLK